MADVTAQIPTTEEVLSKAIDSIMNESVPSVIDSSPFIVGAGVKDISELPSLPNGTLDTPVCNACEETLPTSTSVSESESESDSTNIERPSSDSEKEVPINHRPRDICETKSEAADTSEKETSTDASDASDASDTTDEESELENTHVHYVTVDTKGLELIIPREITVLMLAVLFLNFMNFVFVTSGVRECLAKMP